MATDKEEIPHLIANWWLQERLGSGYSGSIFRAKHIHTGQVVALKVQRVDHECPTNRYERGFYPSLQGGVGMPTLWASGVEGMWDYLAIDLLGASLDSLYRRSGKETMDLRSVCCIAMQMISRLEFMHSRGILHRDIQLGNATIGLSPNEKTIYMIDFGFSKRYIDSYTHRHIPDSKAKRDFIGNYWFSSVGVHCRGKVPSRRDDLEAVSLMLIHLLTPRGLSWTRNGVPKTSAAHEILKREKRLARPEDLCRGLPNEFEELLRYCRKLKFQECPDYQYWIEEFRELGQSHGFPPSSEFIWPPPKPVSVKPKSKASAADDLAKVLDDLGRMNLGENQTLADRTNVAKAVRQAKQDARRDSDKHTVISSNADGQENDDSVPPAHMLPKAYKLAKLTIKVSSATDNAALSDLVLEFIKIMKSNTSRTLIKDGFSFLDALNKQLEDPSVFVLPMRTSRPKDVSSTQTETSHTKLGVVARLQRDVGKAKNNRQLATMVQDFGRVTNRSSGRTITKDGFSFLEGLARQLKALQ
ncbi:kinase-like domain-containing protein [Lentinula raphanica]|nr:kinase-like domain-containing protein [Lentinula raphanica]KAJ3827613.1 kinase-like domain-containing protein [Lentinula raphanica]KAJ3966996.1 kinase-like domain-containing protein [Lentinula raphanica]